MNGKKKYNYDDWVEHIHSLNIGMTKDKLITFDEVDFTNFNKYQSYITNWLYILSFLIVERP